MKAGVFAHLQAVTAEPDLGGTPYRYLGTLGKGGMGTVYCVEDTRLGREVALKALDVEVEEAKVVARLEHPGIVPVHDVGRLPDGRAYYVMKRVQGQTLDAWLAHGPPLAARVRMFHRICDAVGFAHAQCVVHRDLKPQNVMVGSHGEALVMDWGLSLVPGRAGTRGFMAPEQEQGGAVDARADVYALGVVLEGLLGAEAPAPLKSVIACARQGDPKARYADARALGADVAAWLDGAAVSVHREGLGEKLGRWYRTYQVLILLVVAYLVMRTLVAVLVR